MGGKRKKGSRGKCSGKGAGKGREPKAGQDHDSDSDADSNAPPRKIQRGVIGADGWREQSEGPQIMENASFEAYYRRQNICPESEWPAFLEAMRNGLPVAIRVNIMRAGAKGLHDRLSELQEACANNPEREVCAPERLTWFPGGIAWQWRGLARRHIKKDPQHAKLKDFLLQRERSGLITRQEVVSMLPPLFLDVEPHHSVLDLCAAPGSKTSQMIEQMHKSSPSGSVMANELQWKRANMLAHQVSRLGSPCVSVVNIDAQFFPELWEGDASMSDKEHKVFHFDRILCDVPCSGDGTIRKNPHIWSSWTRLDGLALHIRQFSILGRGLDLLRVGGRLVYSTCSLNPMENESVVTAVLRRHKGAVRLLPPPASLLGLKVGQGLERWVVPDQKDENKYYEAYSEVPQERRIGKLRLLPSMFPLLADEPLADEFRRQVRSCCCRMLPHLMDTGGFFVALFEKVSECQPSAKARRRMSRAERKSGSAAGPGDGEGEVEEDGGLEDDDVENEGVDGGDEDAIVDNATPQDVGAMSKLAESVVNVSSAAQGEPEAKLNCLQPPQRLKPITNEYREASILGGYWKQIVDFYGLDESQMFFVRGKADLEKQIYLQSPSAAKMLRLRVLTPTRIVLSGVVAFQRSDAFQERSCPWELVQDGLPALCEAGTLTRRRLQLDLPLMRQLLKDRELTNAELKAASARGSLLGLELLECSPSVAGEQALLFGSVAVQLIGGGDGSEGHKRFAVAAILSDCGLEVAAKERAALLAELGSQPTIEEILGLCPTSATETTV